jgi:hypothetical protein
MRKILIITASIFCVLGIVFTILPMGTIAIIPNGLALIVAFLAFKKSHGNQQNFPKIVLFVTGICLLLVIGKELFIKDEVAKDAAFEKTKIENKKEDKKELEELENDLE